MRVFMGLAAVVALGLLPAAAGAATLTYSAFYPGNNNADSTQGTPAFAPTDWDGTTQSVTLPQFDPALGTLTDATLNLYGNINSSGALTNTGSSAITVSNYSAQMDISLVLPDGSLLTASPTQFSITTPLTLAPGEAYAFGADAPVDTAEFSSVSATALDPFSGPGSVTFPLLAATSVNSPNNDLQITQTTGARAQATITYTYDAVAATDVPEPASAALLGAGLLGLGLVRRRR